MNQTCNGTRFIIEDIYYYRCIYDGKFIRGQIQSGCECPNCKRPVKFGKQIKDPPTRTLIEILIPTLGWVRFKYTNEEL